MANAVAIDSRRTWRGTAPVSPETAPSEHEQMHLPASTDPEFRMLSDTAIEDTVSPPRESRSGEVNITRMSVPLLIVIAVVTAAFSGAITASGVYWAFRLSNQESQAEMQADIRSIKEGMASREREDAANQRADAAEFKLQLQSFETTKQAVDSMRGVVQLLQIQMADLLKQQRR